MAHHLAHGQNATAQGQALCWILDDLLDAEDDLLELARRPGGLSRWQRQQLLGFCERVQQQMG